MTNIIQFPGTQPETTQEKDNFCGAAGFMFESKPSPLMTKVYELEAGAMSHMALVLRDSETAGVEYHGPDALTEEFKILLLEVLQRRQKENVRNGRILTVSHPLMERDEQIPFLAERSEIPAITVRASTREDLEMMNSLRDLFPILTDIRNAIGSSKTRGKLPGLFV